MHSSTLWEYAPRPNYVTNIDKEYPYSELPYITDHHLVKIPISLNKLIDHVDYWGEGRIVAKDGVVGFTNCYNVNQAYRLVSNGPDTNKKIPNRIPVESYDNCDTTAYIRDSSVETVTVVGLNESCIADIVRIVNNDLGKVIVFGSGYYWEITNKLTNMLKEKSLFYCPHYELPIELQGLTQNDKPMSFDAFLNKNLMKKEFLKLYNKGNFENAVNVIKHLDDERAGTAIKDIIMELLKTKRNGDNKIMSFAYTLWNNEGHGIIQNHFPQVFKLILSQDSLMIRNYEYKQPLKLAVGEDPYGERRAWGHDGEVDTQNFTWRFIPVLRNNEVIFELTFIENDLFLKLSVDVDDDGDRHAWGGHASDDDRYKYYVEPQIQEDGTLAFFIVNYKYKQGLKLGLYPAKKGDKKLYGHNGDIYSQNRFKWSISLW